MVIWCKKGTIVPKLHPKLALWVQVGIKCANFTKDMSMILCNLHIHHRTNAL